MPDTPATAGTGTPATAGTGTPATAGTGTPPTPAAPAAPSSQASESPLAPATLAVHAGRPAHAPGAPSSEPPVLSATFAEGGPVSYGRAGNPTWTALEQALAALEGPGCTAVSFASGMAAIAAVAELVPVAGVVVSPSVAYSGTRSLLQRWHRAGRIRLVEVPPTTSALALAAASPEVRMVWLETPVNPTLEVIDLKEVCTAAGRAALRVVDSTFATPLGQRPLALGADIVVHSATKYLSGHSDVLLGVATVAVPALAERLVDNRTLGGGIPGPVEAWLALRGLRTLPLRFERACATAGQIALRCAAHPAVSRVRHPGLPGDPGHGAAQRQMSAFGAIVSLELHGGVEAAQRLVSATRLWSHATSLGGVESTLERRRRWPEESPEVPESLVRLSVGIEDPEDLWRDLAQALDQSQLPGDGHDHPAGGH